MFILSPLSRWSIISLSLSYIVGISLYWNPRRREISISPLSPSPFLEIQELSKGPNVGNNSKDGIRQFLPPCRNSFMINWVSPNPLWFIVQKLFHMCVSLYYISVIIKEWKLQWTIEGTRRRRISNVLSFSSLIWDFQKGRDNQVSPLRILDTLENKDGNIKNFEGYIELSSSSIVNQIQFKTDENLSLHKSNLIRSRFKVNFTRKI